MGDRIAVVLLQIFAEISIWAASFELLVRTQGRYWDLKRFNPISQLDLCQDHPETSGLNKRLTCAIIELAVKAHVPQVGVISS